MELCSESLYECDGVSTINPLATRVVRRAAVCMNVTSQHAQVGQHRYNMGVSVSAVHPPALPRKQSVWAISTPPSEVPPDVLTFIQLLPRLPCLPHPAQRPPSICKRALNKHPPFLSTSCSY